MTEHRMPELPEGYFWQVDADWWMGRVVGLRVKLKKEPSEFRLFFNKNAKPRTYDWKFYNDKDGTTPEDRAKAAVVLAKEIQTRTGVRIPGPPPTIDVNGLTGATLGENVAGSVLHYKKDDTHDS